MEIALSLSAEARAPEANSSEEPPIMQCVNKYYRVFTGEFVSEICSKGEKVARCTAEAIRTQKSDPSDPIYRIFRHAYASCLVVTMRNDVKKASWDEEAACITTELHIEEISNAYRAGTGGTLDESQQRIKEIRATHNCNSYRTRTAREASRKLS